MRRRDVRIRTVAQIKQCPLRPFKEEMLTCTECALHQFVRICNVRAESLAPCSNLRKDRALIGGGWVVCAERVQECTLLWKRT